MGQEAKGPGEAPQPAADSAASQRIFEARVAEYGLARGELVGAIANQHLVLTFGAASILAVLVAGFLTWDSTASWAIFFAVPPISAWVLGMWLGEVVRMLRASEFCREQEEIVNRSLGMEETAEPPLRWERWRRHGPGRTIRWSYQSVVAILAGAYITAVPLGLITANWKTVWTVVVAAAFGAGLILLLTLVFQAYRRWGRDPSL